MTWLMFNGKPRMSSKSLLDLVTGTPGNTEVQVTKV